MPPRDDERPTIFECNGAPVPDGVGESEMDNEAMDLDPEQAKAFRALQDAGLNPTIVEDHPLESSSNS